MSKCMQHNTIKVPQGNAWQLLLPLKTAHWSGKDLVTETIDYRALEDVQVLIDGVVWEDWQMTEDGPLCNIPADMPLGPHNTVITATYVGVEVKASYFENFTIVAWSFESNVGEHLLDAPLVSEAAYIYVGITDDEELEALKQQYREATAACETARLQYEAAKEEFDEKAEQLDDVATQEAINTLKTALQGDNAQATLTAILAAFGNIDFSTLAKQGDNPAATNSAILEALSHINPQDPNSKALAEFFGVTVLQGYEFMQDTEVTDKLEDIMQALDPELTAEQAASITAEAMNIINDEEQSEP